MTIDPNAPMPQPVPPAQASPAQSTDVDVSKVQDQGGQPIPTVSGQPTAPLPAGTQLNTNPNAPAGSVEPKHNMLGSIFQDLAGGKKTVWTQTENGPVASKQNLAPGEIARSILAAAITGLAAGGAADTRKNPSAGFAAGAEAAGQQRQDIATKNQNQAQEQFKNQQTTDELTLRKMQNAREQQASIQNAQEHDIRMQVANQDLQNGKFYALEHLAEFNDKQVDRLNVLRTAGLTPLMGTDGKPVPEFNSGEEALAWADKNPQLAIQPGKYTTQVEVDPATNRFMIMQKPKGYDDPQWLGVELDSNGKPKTDKDGKFIPDGAFKQNGKATAPAGQISPHQFADSQLHELELQTKILTLEEAKERLATVKLAREKDETSKIADDQFNKANGNPDALDANGNFIVSPSSRMILKDRYIKEGSLEASIYNSATKEIEDPKYELDPSAKADLQSTIDSSRNNLAQIQANLLMLSRTPNAGDVISKTLQTQYAGNTDAQIKALDSMKIPSGTKDYVRQKLTATPPDVLADPKNLQKAVDIYTTMLQGGTSMADVIANINRSTTVSSADKTRLINALKPQQPQQPDRPAESLGEAASRAVKAIKGNDVPSSTPIPEPVAAQ